MTNDEMAVILQPYLDEIAKTDLFLAEAMKKENKSMNECIRYIMFKVNGTKNTTSIVDGNEVLEMAKEYYKDDTIVMPNMSNPSKATAKVKEAKPKTEKKEKVKKETKKAELKPSNENWLGGLFDEL